MAGAAELDPALTAQEVFASTFEAADAMAEQFDGLRSAGGREAHERDIPRTNLLLAPFSNVDKQTGAGVASRHVRLVEGIKESPVLSVSNIFRGFGDEGSPLAAGVYRAEERVPDYVLWQMPDSDLIVATIGRTGLVGEELPEGEVAGDTKVAASAALGEMDPEDRERLTLVTGAIRGRIAALETVVEVLGDKSVEKVEYTGADTEPELIYPQTD